MRCSLKSLRWGFKWGASLLCHIVKGSWLRSFPCGVQGFPHQYRPRSWGERKARSIHRGGFLFCSLCFSRGPVLEDKHYPSADISLSMALSHSHIYSVSLQGTHGMAVTWEEDGKRLWWNRNNLSPQLLLQMGLHRWHMTPYPSPAESLGKHFGVSHSRPLSNGQITRAGWYRRSGSGAWTALWVCSGPKE